MKNFPNTLYKFYFFVIKQFPLFFISIFILDLIEIIFMRLSGPLITKWTFQLFEFKDNYEINMVINIFILISGMYLFDFFENILQDRTTAKFRPTVNIYCDNILYKRIYNNDVDFFINKPAGQIQSKIEIIRSNLETVTTAFWVEVSGLFISFAFLSGMLLKMNPLLSLLVIGNGVIRLSWQMFMQRTINKLKERIVDVTSKNNGIRTDSIGNAITAKLFGNTNFENDYICDKKQEEIKLSVRDHFLQRLRWGPVDLLGIITNVTLIFLCWLFVKNGDMLISEAAFAIAAFNVINDMFNKARRIIQVVSESKSQAKHAFKDMIIEQKICDFENTKNLRIKNGSISIEGVSFNYGSKDIIKNLDISFDGGEKIGLVGLSGAGKTTLVNLLLRLYDPTSGLIKIDGQDIKYVKQESLRRQISFVPQDPILFNRSLLENIKYAVPNATMKQVIAAAKIANIDEFINSLPNKYETLVGNHGVKLSGGQRQRIAIARSILKNAPILIFDEATSSLDSENEFLVQAALQKAMQNKTTIVISHRLSTLRDMDRIIVLDDGRIKESGTHDELLKKKNGIYYRLWQKQNHKI